MRNPQDNDGSRGSFGSEMNVHRSWGLQGDRHLVDEADLHDRDQARRDNRRYDDRVQEGESFFSRLGHMFRR